MHAITVAQDTFYGANRIIKSTLIRIVTNTTTVLGEFISEDANKCTVIGNSLPFTAKMSLFTT